MLSIPLNGFEACLAVLIPHSHHSSLSIPLNGFITPSSISLFTSPPRTLSIPLNGFRLNLRDAEDIFSYAYSLSIPLNGFGGVVWEHP